MNKDIEPLIAVAPPPRKKLKLLVAVGASLAVLVVGGALWASGMLAPGSRNKGVQPVLAQHSVFIETPEMVTNLDAGPHRLSFVKIQCRIEVARASDASIITTAMPRIVDMVQTYLRETRPEELRSDAGTYRLREALLLRASLAGGGADVRDVLFEELIVQ